MLNSPYIPEEFLLLALYNLLDLHPISSLLRHHLLVSGLVVGHHNL